jgi:hypothetical protein
MREINYFNFFKYVFNVLTYIYIYSEKEYKEEVLTT